MTSNQHGGGYVPDNVTDAGSQDIQTAIPKHGGDYLPGSHSTSTQAGDAMIAAPQTATSPGNYTRQAQQSPQYQQSAASPNKVYQRAPESDESMLKSEAVEFVRSDTVNDRQAAQLRGFRNAFHPLNRWRWKFPSAHLSPTWSYDSNTQHRHRDLLTRQWTGYADDRYLSPYDGHVAKLVVQATDDLYNLAGHTTYMRTYVRNMSPYMLRIATWPTDHLDFLEGRGQNGEVLMVMAKWIPAVCALSVMLLFPGNASGQIRNGGNYDVFPYKYYGYAKAARNASENSTAPRTQKLIEQLNPIAERALRPRYLCFLSEDDSVQRQKVDDWTVEHPGQSLDYVFIAYTAEQFAHSSDSDMKALHVIAKEAARDEGLAAYWVGCSCMPDPTEMQDDVYRISDIIRGARSLVIAVGPSHTAKTPTTDLMLKQWGQRMWTYPEVLLSPGASIKIYTRNEQQAQLMLKRQFAASVWSDAAVSRQLIDHYEGSLILGQLELVILALKCLHGRDTSEYLPGDRSYALMGLLRVRPKIDQSDSAFQAFARLSLANNSDMLLERLICTLPEDSEQHWSCMDDAWNVNMWDIYPTCQIAGIGHDDTVIIDGLRGANVRWKSFQRVRNITKVNGTRRLTQWAQHTVPLFLWTAITLLAVGQTAVGGVMMFYAVVMLMLSPYMMRLLYGGKFWYTQPWLFGFEGHMSIETIERQVFGANLGRLNWSPYSSPLSRHCKNEHGECVGMDPISDPATASLIEQARYARPGDQRIFTIVATGSMQVTMFQAKRPPVAFLIAGEEGGMQRAIGVSYQWETATCYRETVLRVETPLMERMDRVPRLRFGLKREMLPVKTVTQSV